MEIQLRPNKVDPVLRFGVADDGTVALLLGGVAGVGLIPELIRAGLRVAPNAGPADGHFPRLDFANQGVLRMALGLIQHPARPRSIQDVVVIDQKQGPALGQFELPLRRRPRGDALARNPSGGQAGTQRGERPNKFGHLHGKSVCDTLSVRAEQEHEIHPDRAVLPRPMKPRAHTAECLMKFR